jgi:RNA-directed DNA polymerase
MVICLLERDIAQGRHVRLSDDVCCLRVIGQRLFRPFGILIYFITQRLKLKVNQAKGAVVHPWQWKFPEFSFTAGREPGQRIAPKAIARLNKRILEQTRRTRSIRVRQMVKDLTTYLPVWLGYFGNCQTPSVLQGLESWLRRRLRPVVGKQWKGG